MKVKLSNSAVDKYLECSLCYYLHYTEGIRPVKNSSALVFGGCVDKAFNILLVDRDLQKALDFFDNEWNQHKDAKNVTFYKTNEDIELVRHFGIEPEKDKVAWWSMYFTGKLLIEAYYKEVLPKIKKVVAVQEPITITNSDGDEIIGNLDLDVIWQDDKNYILDNKTSKNLYDPNVKKEDQYYGPTSPKDSQQLPLYYFAKNCKHDGVGYIVLRKIINKNKIKKCKICNKLNKTTHKTCPELVNLDIHKRCNGEFNITLNPTVDIDYIFNQVDESDIDRVIGTFDKVNNLISNNVFSDTHKEERGKFGFCPYKEYYEGSPDFIKKDKK